MTKAAFPFVSAAVFAAIHLIIYYGFLKNALKNRASKTAIAALLCANFAAVLAYLFFRAYPAIPQPLYFALSLSIGVAFCLFVAAALYLCASFAALALPKHTREKTRQIARLCALGVGILFIAVGIYGGSRIIPTHTNIAIPGLKAPLRAALLTDIHIGGLVDATAVAHIVEMTNAQQPDLIFLVGDIVDAPLDEVEAAVAELGRLKAPHGVFFTLGNHEYFHGAEAIVARLLALGNITPLLNESVESAGLNIAGVNDLMGLSIAQWLGESSTDSSGNLAVSNENSAPDSYALAPNLPKTFENLNPNLPTILLSHQPKIIEYFDKDASALAAQMRKEIRHYAPDLVSFEKISLVLSGHTHGGQIFPFSLAVALVQPHISGLFAHARKDGSTTQLFISQGVGFWGPPMRVGTICELAILELIPE